MRWVISTFAAGLALFLCSCAPAPSLKPLPPGAVIAAFGDSLTFGSGADPVESYPAVLAALVSREVVNAGVPGDRAVDGSRRLPAFLEEKKPALVLLCLGGNDMLAKTDPALIKEDLRRMIQVIRSSGAQVWLLAVPNPKTLWPAKIYGELGREMRVPVDKETLPRLFKDQTMHSDAIHLNARGYRAWAEALAERLRKEGAI